MTAANRLKNYGLTLWKTHRDRYRLKPMRAIQNEIWIKPA